MEENNMQTNKQGKLKINVIDDKKGAGRKDRKAGDIAFYILDYAFYALFTLACLFPFYYLFINTISAPEFVGRGEVNFLPRGFTLENYIALTSDHNVF